MDHPPVPTTKKLTDYSKFSNYAIQNLNLDSNYARSRSTGAPTVSNGEGVLISPIESTSNSTSSNPIAPTRERPTHQLVQLYHHHESEDDEFGSGGSSYQESNDFSDLMSGQEEKAWRENLWITLLPLLCFGIPIHLVLMKKHIYTRAQWIKSLFPTEKPLLFAFNLFILAISLFYNVYVIKDLISIFDLLIIRGQIKLSIFESILNLGQILPILIPINFIWIYGFMFRELVLSFSKVNISPRLMNSFHSVPVKVHLAEPSYNLPRIKVKLIFMYFLILFIHVVHLFMYGNRSAGVGAGAIVDDLGYYFIGPIMNTMILPVYATFCWSFIRQFRILAYYLKSLGTIRTVPQFEHFKNFKRFFCETCNRIQLLNRLFSLYISLVFGSVLVSLYIEGWDLINVVANAQPLVPPTNNPLDPSTTIKPDALMSSTSGILVDGFVAALVDSKTSRNLQQAPNGLEELQPYVVRSVVGIGFVALFKLILVGFTIWQAIGVNDEAKYLLVWLNDFVTESSKALTLEHYQSFRLLKYYIESRMVQPRMSLIRIPIVGFLPALRSRLYTSHW